MKLQERINLLKKLGEYLVSAAEEWAAAKHDASRQNGWFTEQFIDIAVNAIVTQLLDERKLLDYTSSYAIPEEQAPPKTVGLVMAGNIPLVGFQDWLHIFLSGHYAMVKRSSKDQVLITHIVNKLAEWHEAVAQQTRFADMLKGCDAYIATGSNNTARYFEYYFGRYPHIIRRNRTSVAVLTGSETADELDRLTNDVHYYYGLGCRNVTKIFVPGGYNFEALLGALNKYEDFAQHHKYKNNYDYQLAILLLNNKYYMTNGSVLLTENDSLFSAISQLHYEFYTPPPEGLLKTLENHPDIQCVVGAGGLDFGQAQQPELADYADGIDTMAFLLQLPGPH